MLYIFYTLFFILLNCCVYDYLKQSNHVKPLYRNIFIAAVLIVAALHFVVKGFFFPFEDFMRLVVMSFVPVFVYYGNKIRAKRMDALVQKNDRLASSDFVIRFRGMSDFLFNIIFNYLIFAIVYVSQVIHIWYPVLKTKL